MVGHCRCFSQESAEHPQLAPLMHGVQQDTNCDAWKHLLAVIESNAESADEVLSLNDHLTWEELSQIVTLPTTIAKLKNVRRLRLYGSSLGRIPPEIGEMAALEIFEPYTSYRLHWFPYEITKCPNFRISCISTRAIYGNHKYRPPFPDLRSESNYEALASTVPSRCSVCRSPLTEGEIERRWISLRVATDVVPLLVNACSVDCIAALPSPPKGYVCEPHTGGMGVVQPERDTR